jgi:ABC-type branched-subunit amino acid transport system permease subunit
VIDARTLSPYLGAAAACTALVLVVPSLFGASTLINQTIYAAFAILALSLALIWGAGGILSLGQAAFFGIGGYAYAVVAINNGSPLLGLLAAVAVPILFSALLGYFMFWGHVNDVYVAVMTLTVTQILRHFVDQTGGSQWRIGSVALGGFNGIPDVPVLDWPIGSGDPISPQQLYVFAMIVLTLCYVGCKAALASRFGRILVAIRENEVRSDLLGYDARLYKQAAFMMGGGLAGLAGALFANAVFVSPQMFGLNVSVEVIICVIVGGVGSLFGAILGSFLVQALTTWLGTLGQHSGFHWVDPNLALGLVLVGCVILAPKGITSMLMQALARPLKGPMNQLRQKALLASWRGNNA